MADGVDVTPGSGIKIETDERTLDTVTKHVQRIVGIGSTTNAAGQVEISNTAANIVAAQAKRARIIIINRQTVPVFIDPAGTATTADLRLDPGDSIVLFVTTAISAITSAAYTATGDAKVHYIEEYD